jgi:hypothetical protein
MIHTERFDPLDPRIEVGNWVRDAFNWFTDTFQPVLDVIDDGLSGARRSPDVRVTASRGCAQRRGH